MVLLQIVNMMHKIKFVFQFFALISPHICEWHYNRNNTLV